VHPLRLARGRAFAALLTAGLAGTPAAVAAADVSSSMESGDAIQFATFSLDAGAIYVNLPRDVAPGDRASATVNPVPAGGAEKDVKKQREELHRYGVQIGGARAPASERVRTFTVPRDASAVPIALVDRRGERVAEVQATVGPASPVPAGYAVPEVGQGGAPVRIAGPFDGDLSNSSARIGGKDADAIAESPRELLLRGPQEGSAETAVEVRERGAVVTSGTYRNVGVRLAADATTLRSGQRTTLTVTVTGVEGLRETLPVRLTNRSPSVVRMEGGDEQTLCVRPDEVGNTGTWTAKRGLTGVRLGGFSIGTEVRQPRPHAEGWTRIEGSLQGELRAGLVLERPARVDPGAELSPGGYAVLVRGAGDGGAVSLLLRSREGGAATVPGAVFKRVRSATLCDRDDASDAARQARSGTGNPGFDELGFANDEAFEVRESGRGLRLVLSTDEDAFSIEAELGASAP